MRRILQRIGNGGGYYAGPGRWTSDVKDAIVFKDSLSAIQCCVREGLYGVQLVIHFDQGGPEIRLPVFSAENCGHRFRPRL